MRRKRRPSPVGLSFLDAMTCGLGAVVLLFIVINASIEEQTKIVTKDLSAEVDRLETEVLEDHARMVELRNTTLEVENDRVRANGLARRLIENLDRPETDRFAIYLGALFGLAMESLRGRDTLPGGIPPISPPPAPKSR